MFNSGSSIPLISHLSNMPDDGPDETETAEDFARRQLRRQQHMEEVKELTEGMIGAGSQVVIYEPAVSWLRIERALAAIGLTIPILGFLALGIENALSISIPTLWPISASIGMVLLGDYAWHRRFGSIPEPPEHPLEREER